MELMLTRAAEPLVIPTGYWLGTGLLLLLSVLNLWRFRTGWRMLGRHYRPGLTEYAIQMGFASIPFLVAMLVMLLVGLCGPIASREQSALFGYATLLGAALFLGGTVVGAKESKRPSRWNKPPRWLVEARANGSLRLSARSRHRHFRKRERPGHERSNGHS
jgi:hypothetical protein